MYVKHFTSVSGIKVTSMTTAQKVGNAIKEARRLKGLTQTNVAQIFHMTQQQYSRFENGVFELNYQQIIDICKLLDITPNDIFDFN